jgi:hypothetical protein
MGIILGAPTARLLLWAMLASFSGAPGWTFVATMGLSAVQRWPDRDFKRSRAVAPPPLTLSLNLPMTRN